MKPLPSISAIALTVSLLGFPQLSYAQDATQKLFFEGDMVRGAGSAQPACVLNSQFRRNEAVVWRVRVLDQTGKRLNDKGLKSVVVELSDGRKFPMHYGPHPVGKTDDYFWTSSWRISENYPTGSFAYKVLAIGLDGQNNTWSQFNVNLSELTVIR